jgi:hypothetical protein
MKVRQTWITSFFSQRGTGSRESKDREKYGGTWEVHDVQVEYDLLGNRRTEITFSGEVKFIWLVYSRKGLRNVWKCVLNVFVIVKMQDVVYASRSSLTCILNSIDSMRVSFSSALHRMVCTRID